MAFVYAVTALDQFDQRHRLPPRSRVLAFCRAALDVCAAPLIDAGPRTPALIDMVPPPDAVKGDRIGRLLAQYDPAVRHAADLAQPLQGAAAVFVYDPLRGAYVLEEEPQGDMPDLTGSGSGSGTRSGSDGTSSRM